MNTPSRKVIQLLIHNHVIEAWDEHKAGTLPGGDVLILVCDDGTIWQRVVASRKPWEQVKDLPPGCTPTSD